MKTFPVILLVALSGAPCAAAQRAGSTSAAQTVTQLYAQFACEAASVSGCPHNGNLSDQPRAALARYFDEELLRLWFADRTCRQVAGAQDICWFERLDFYPMWDAWPGSKGAASGGVDEQVGTTFTVRPTSDTTAVEVELKLPSGDHVVLRYSLVQSPAGWRIHDISKGKLWSLLAVLSRTGGSSSGPRSR